MHARPAVRAAVQVLIAIPGRNSLSAVLTGIYLSNTPGAVDDATATTALYLLLSTMRQYAHAERSVRELKWKPAGISARTHDLTGKTLAILGLGGIGGRLAELVHAFPMRVIYHSRSRNPDAPAFCEYFADVDAMLAQTDVLSVHVPLRAETVGLVGEKMIRALKPGAIIVNTARGKVIDEAALIEALRAGRIAGAALDVFAEEPLPADSSLWSLPNVIVTPHISGNSDRYDEMVTDVFVENLARYLDDRPLLNVLDRARGY